MFGIVLNVLLCIGLVYGNFFDFFQNHFQHQQPEGQVQNPEAYESQVLNIRCNRYLCPDTGICVDEPKLCPCPYPSSQLRCFLPNGKFVCISKPAGEQFANKYDDPKNSWKVDAKDDNVRDCGWVIRAYNGLV